MQDNETIKPFTTDGCSGGMSFIYKLIFKKPPPWEEDCVEHDKSYHKGGSSKQRRKSDVKLMCKVAKRGYPNLAYCMFIAVRLGGNPYLPFPWRWGYGYKYPKPYQKENTVNTKTE